jgi:hypothetical protein
MIINKYFQIINPYLFVEDVPGFSLRYVQSTFKAPIRHHTAWEAWEATEFKHLTQDEDYKLPDVYVPIFFRSLINGKNIGHVAVWDPKLKAVHAPPYAGFGKLIITIEEIEKRSGGTTVCVGWSEDFNGLRIVR